MYKQISILIITCSIISQTIAQPIQTIGNAVSFRSIFNVGILTGQTDKNSLQIQTVNGLLIKTWFTGIGVGIDYYGAKRSIPLFAAIQKDLKTQRKTPFAYAHAGYNFSWLNDKEKIQYRNQTYMQLGGLFYELGIGYKLVLKNKMQLGLSTGYSYKKQSEKMVTQSFCTECIPRQIPPVEQYDFTFRRISIKMNWWF